MIIKCPECGHELSDKSVSCPKCGYPLNDFKEDTQPKLNDGITPKSKKKWVIASVIAIAVIVLSVGFWFAFDKVFFTNSPTEFSTICLDTPSAIDPDTLSTNDPDTFSNDDPDAIVELTPEFIEKVQQYDNLRPFSEGLAAVCKDAKWGYINTKGEEVIECQFDRAEEFHEGISQVVSEDKPYYTNRKGDKLFYGEGGRFSQGLALLDDGRVVNQEGEDVFKVELYTMAYSTSRVPNSSYYSEFPYFIDSVITVWGNERQKSYDINGKGMPSREIPDKIRRYKEFTDDVDYDSFNTDNHTGLKDENGKTVIAPQYSEISDVSNGVALVSYRENDAYFFGLDDEGTALRANDGMYETYAPRFYAYADLHGNTTFSDEVLNHIDEANTIGRQRWETARRNYRKDAESNKGPEWIDGTWKWSGYVNGYHLGCTISFNRDAQRYTFTDLYGDTEKGTYTYDTNKHVIHCRPNGSSGYSTTYEVDTYNHRIDLGNGNYLQRSRN